MSLITVSREQFLARYDKKNTQKMILTSFVAWDRFLLHIHSDESTVFLTMKKKPKEGLLILDHMVQVWKRNKSVKTIESYFQHVKDWLRFNGIKYDPDDIKENVRFPKPIKHRDKGIDRDVIKLLIEHSNPFYKNLLMALISTGIRIDGMLHMTPAWIDFSTHPAKVSVPGKYAKAGVEYITFLTTEVEDRIKEMIRQRKLGPDDIIFDRSYSAFASHIGRLRRKLNLLEKEGNGKFYIVRIHRTRSFTLNRLSRSVGSEFAHAMLGHGESIGKYFGTGMSDEEAGQDYLKGAHAVTIDETIPLKDENKSLREQIKNHDLLEQRLAQAEAKILRLQNKKAG